MNKNKICIIGLGYVGLLLTHAFSEKFQVVGFDINKSRIDELNKGYDRTLELSEIQVKNECGIDLVDNFNIEDYQAIVVAVGHDKYKSIEIKDNKNQIVFDVKSILKNSDGQL